MILTKNRYGFYLQQLPADEYYFHLIDEAVGVKTKEKTKFDMGLNLDPNQQQDASTMNFGDDDMPDLTRKHNGGLAELKLEVDKLKNKALDALGLDRKHVIRSILKKLYDMFTYVKEKVIGVYSRSKPTIKRYADKVANYILDAIDYIRSEFE